MSQEAEEEVDPLAVVSRKADASKTNAFCTQEFLFPTKIKNQSLNFSSGDIGIWNLNFFKI